jgi:hypothetical protein
MDEIPEVLSITVVSQEMPETGSVVPMPISHVSSWEIGLVPLIDA